MQQPHSGAPQGINPPQGLYHPRFEHDACGIGFVAHVKGRKSHEIVQQALTVLQNMDHRGARGSEEDTGDGAGILLQLPHAFLQQACREIQVKLPEPGDYGAGMLHLPRDPAPRQRCQEQFAAIVHEEGQKLLGWRTVPTDNGSLGRAARSAEPAVCQVFIGKGSVSSHPLAFERKLYVIRRRAEREIAPNREVDGQKFYVASLSQRTIVYKGMLTPRQLVSYYPDLSHPALQSALALIHSRFSTNTFPSWERAHPYRYLIHNGEINTLRGNVNWMRAREALLESALFGPDLQKLLPIIDEDGSDSAMFDNCLELLVLSGRSLPHAVMMMIPEH
jgi:glutamate synthase (ferredoxin)